MRTCKRCGDVHPTGACAAGAEGEVEIQRLVGEVVHGRYRIEEVLGEGGMGVVYGSLDTRTGEPVALKVLHPRLHDRPEAIARLLNEARVAGALNHPNICRVIEAGQVADGRPFVAMERLYGETLAERLEREERITWGETCRLACAVLGGLQRAHDAGVIHRDLKPDNVFLEVTGSGDVSPKVLDFGISKTGGAQGLVLTETGMVMGTPYYMAPEQARGDRQLDARIDLWAMGVMLYEAITGKRPFVAKNYNALLVRILTVQHKRLREVEPDVPPGLDEVVESLLAKDRERRLGSASEVARRLAPFADTSRTSGVEISTAETYSEEATSVFVRSEVIASLQHRASAPATLPPLPPGDVETTVVDPPLLDDETTIAETKDRRS